MGKHRKSNPYWYRQTRKEDGEWGSGGVVKPERKPEGFLADKDNHPIAAAPESKYLVGDVVGFKTKSVLGIDPKDLHRMTEGVFGAHEVFDHEASHFAAESYFSKEDNADVMSFAFGNSKKPSDATKFVYKLFTYRDSRKPSIDLSLIMIPDETQSVGQVGKRVLQFCMDLADHTGADRISLTANINVGAYAWARYGFVPTTDSWRALAAPIRKSMAKISEVDTLNSKEVTALQGHIKDLTRPGSNPLNIRAVAALNLPCTHGGHGDTTVGKALLLGNHWHAEALLDDPDTLEHLQATVSGAETWTKADAERVGVSSSKGSYDSGALFSVGANGRNDSHIHKAMLPAGTFVADESGIRMLMRTGLSRAEARQYISSSRGYGQ